MSVPEARDGSDLQTASVLVATVFADCGFVTNPPTGPLGVAVRERLVVRIAEALDAVRHETPFLDFLESLPEEDAEESHTRVLREWLLDDVLVPTALQQLAWELATGFMHVGRFGEAVWCELCCTGAATIETGDAHRDDCLVVRARTCIAAILWGPA